MTFGMRLQQARKTKQLTQIQVAGVLGIDFTTISKYENDKSQPDNSTLQKLANLYDVSLDWLLTGELSSDTKLLRNKIYIEGNLEELTEEEAAYLKDSLEMFRLLKAKRERGKNKSDEPAPRD